MTPPTDSNTKPNQLGGRKFFLGVPTRMYTLVAALLSAMLAF
ncbi:MAG: hypothetical protein WCK15_12870 [Pirellula sp.]